MWIKIKNPHENQADGRGKIKPNSHGALEDVWDSSNIYQLILNSIFSYKPWTVVYYINTEIYMLP